MVARARLRASCWLRQPSSIAVNTCSSRAQQRDRRPRAARPRPAPAARSRTVDHVHPGSRWMGECRIRCEIVNIAAGQPAAEAAVGDPPAAPPVCHDRLCHRRTAADQQRDLLLVRAAQRTVLSSHLIEYAPRGARYAGSRTSRCRGWCGTGGFRGLSTAARFPRVLSTDSGSRPHGPVDSCCASSSDGGRAEGSGGRGGACGLGEPSPWVWLRDGVDRLFHAVSVWELPPEEDGPIAVCGRRVQVVSLLDEPDGGRCPACVAATAPASRERRGTGAAPTWVRLGVVTSSDPMSERACPGARRRARAEAARSESVWVRLSPDEAAVVGEAAARAGMSVGAWVGETAVGRARAEAAGDEPGEAGGVGPSSWRELVAALVALRAEVAAVRRGAGRGARSSCARR